MELYDLTNPQKSIWLTEQFYRGTSINVICGTVLIDDIVNFDVLSKAINIFLKDNDSFRIKLCLDENGEVKQFFQDFCEKHFDVLNVSNNIELKNLEKEIATSPFNILGDALFSITPFQILTGKGGFIVKAHHIIADACTASLVASKIMTTYSSILNEDEEIKSIPTSYINYINSENEYLNSPKFEKDKEYWEEQFQTVPEFGVIPSLIESSAESSHAERQVFEIDNFLLNNINSFCKDNKLSLFNFFMAIYAIYIGKVSNLNDFILGTPILNRTTFLEKNTPGMFISTVPFKFCIQNDKTFVEFAQKISLDSLSMFRHQKYPYQNILEHIRKSKPNQPNLYDILISYQNSKTNRNSCEVPYSVNWTFNGNVADSMQIHIFDMNDEGSLNVAYDFRLNKYSLADIHNIHHRILNIINQILMSSNITLGKINIVTYDEKDLILNKFNDTYLEYNHNKTIVDFFEEQVEKNPNNIALVFKMKTMTYSELNKKVNSLARYLNTNKIRKGSIVGIIVNRSFEMIISILAVLKAGASYIPIDPEYPEERINYILENSNCDAIITLQKQSSKVQSLGFEKLIIIVDLCNEIVYNLPDNNLNNDIAQDDLSYLIFTSGSTGSPKGVMLTHKNLNNFINSMFNKISYLKDGKYHSIISITTMSFDIFIFETLVSLCGGLKLFITDDFEQKITTKIEKLISDNHIEIIQSTPSIMNFHLDNSMINGFSSLKYIMLAGEQLPRRLVDKILKVSPNCTIYNGYGPSETTIFSTVTDVTYLDKITIGKPINNTQIYILNDNLDVLPINCIGEIYISGDGVGKGYIGRDDLTAEKYLKNPFIDGYIMYKTGDVGFWTSYGNIICKGRSDNQIKLRGLRVELGEIENCINSFDTSANILSSVIVREISDAQVLVAYISSDKKIAIGQLRDFIANRLPTYMIPTYFMVLDKLPLTPNGKIDKKELAKYSLNIETTDSIHAPPRNIIEANIVSSIKKKLGISNFGIDDNIFDYGADSLSIISILTDLFQYKISLKVYDFYKNPTVRELYDKVLCATTDNKLSNITRLNSLNDIAKSLNTSESGVEENSKKCVLLTGVTGFLGIHILAELLQNSEKISKIYCLIRPKYHQDINERLLGTLHFYFGTKYDNIAKQIVICVNSDMIVDNLSISAGDYEKLKQDVDLVIHSAANVKHYGDYNLFADVNIGGTQKIIDLCRSINVPLYYISTMTISGNYLLEQSLTDVTFTEKSFYVNQDFTENVYSRSKLFAESLVLEAISKGLNATIFRIGDLSSRYSDGHFQNNISENAIYSRLKSLVEISAIPDSILDNDLEFTPVDFASKALVKIIWSNNGLNRIFHIYNPNTITTKSLLNYMDTLGYNIKVISEKDFMNLVKSISTDEINQYKISGIINDFTKNNDMIYNHIIKEDNYITCKYLNSLGFYWPDLNYDYFKKLIKYMQDVGFIK